MLLYFLLCVLPFVLLRALHSAPALNFGFAHGLLLPGHRIKRVQRIFIVATRSSNILSRQNRIAERRLPTRALEGFVHDDLGSLLLFLCIESSCWRRQNVARENCGDKMWLCLSCQKLVGISMFTLKQSVKISTKALERSSTIARGQEKPSEAVC